MIETFRLGPLYNRKNSQNDPLQTKFLQIITTVQSRFSDTLFSDKSRFSDNFAEDHFLVHKNISFSDNLAFSAPLI